MLRVGRRTTAGGPALLRALTAGVDRRLADRQVSPGSPRYRRSPRPRQGLRSPWPHYARGGTAGPAASRAAGPDAPEARPERRRVHEKRPLPVGPGPEGRSAPVRCATSREGRRHRTDWPSAAGRADGHRRTRRVGLSPGGRRLAPGRPPPRRRIGSAVTLFRAARVETTRRAAGQSASVPVGTLPDGRAVRACGFRSDVGWDEFARFRPADTPGTHSSVTG